MFPWVSPWLNKTSIRVMRNWKIHCIRPNYQSARSKWYDECFAKDLPILSIDRASTEIYRPQIEPQDLYFFGSRHFHAIHTNVVIDSLENATDLLQRT
jgi:di/tripeptidase